MSQFHPFGQLFDQHPWLYSVVVSNDFTREEHRMLAQRAISVLTACLIVYLCLFNNAYAQENKRKVSVQPLRVLITNDNGIDDPKILALAKAFSHQADVWVVAPDRDQSGVGAKLTFFQTGELKAKRREIAPGIKAWSVSGTPGDCVVFAGAILMSENPPDLVVSGINGGANMGTDWMYSGTIGAARVAAFGGIPAIALSGLDDRIAGAVDAAAEWAVRLAHSEIVKTLEPGDYITVSLPTIAPSKIRGIRIVDRAPGLPRPQFKKSDDSTWRLVGLEYSDVEIPKHSDRGVCKDGFIAVVPMRLDEIDRKKLEKWGKQNKQCPPWNTNNE